jgi:hypothetical protein
MPEGIKQVQRVVVQARRPARAEAVEDRFIREIFPKISEKARRELVTLVNIEIDRWSKRLILLECFFLGDQLNEYSVQEIVDKAFGTSGEFGLSERFNLKYILAGRISNEKEQAFWEENVLPGQKNARNILNKWAQKELLIQKTGRNFHLTPEGMSIAQFFYLRLLSELHVGLPIEEGRVPIEDLEGEPEEVEESPTPAITWETLENMFLVERNLVGEYVIFTPTGFAQDLLEFVLLHPYADRAAFRSIRRRCLFALEQNLLSQLEEKATVVPLLKNDPNPEGEAAIESLDDVDWIYLLDVKGRLQQEFVHDFLFSSPVQGKPAPENNPPTNIMIIESPPGTGKSIWALQTAMNLLLRIKQEEFRTLPIIFHMHRFGLVEEEGERYLVYGDSLLAPFLARKDRDADHFEEVIGALIATVLPFEENRELLNWNSISSKLFRGCFLILFFDEWEQVDPDLRPFFCQLFNFLTRDEYQQLKIIITTRWVDTKLAAFVQESWGGWGYEEDEFSNVFELELPDADQINNYFKTCNIEIASDGDLVEDLELLFGKLLAPFDLWLIYLFKKSDRWPATRADLYYRWIKYETLVEYYQNFNRRFPTIRSDTELDKLFSNAIGYYREEDERNFSLEELFEGPVPGATATDEHNDYSVLNFLPNLAYHQMRDPEYFFPFAKAVKNNPLLERFIQIEFTEELHHNCRITSEHYVDYFVAMYCANRYWQGLTYFIPEGETIELFFDEIVNANVPSEDEEIE